MVSLTILFATMLSLMSYRMVVLRMNGRPGRRAPRMLSITQFPFEPLPEGGLDSPSPQQRTCR